MIPIVLLYKSDKTNQKLHVALYQHGCKILCYYVHTSIFIRAEVLFGQIQIVMVRPSEKKLFLVRGTRNMVYFFHIASKLIYFLDEAIVISMTSSYEKKKQRMPIT